jgi:CHASE2 domain-containing sensor protein
MPVSKNVFKNMRLLFTIYLFFGVIILFCCHLIENTDWGENGINKVFDYIIRNEAKNSASSAGNTTSIGNDKISDRIIFIDIDDDTYKDWGNPLITPRDKIALIIENAYKGGAKIIIPDILFEYEDFYHPGADNKLKEVFKDMTNRGVVTKVIFPVRSDSHGNIRQNFFHELIDMNANFYTASADISAPSSDGTSRYWVPYESMKRGDENKLIWNMAFLAAILAEGKEPELRKLETTLQTGKLPEDYIFKLDDGRKIVLSLDIDGNIKSDIFANRIRFLLIPEKTLTGYPAGNLFENVYKANESANAPFKDKIVIIGNSSPDSGDTYRTPIGRMAGMYIIGNAENTILQGIQPPRLSAFWSALLEVAVLIIMAYLFSYLTHLSRSKQLRGFIVSLLFSVMLPILFGVLSYYIFLRCGVFLNFFFVSVTIGFLSNAVGAIDLIEQRMAKQPHYSKVDA